MSININDLDQEQYDDTEAVLVQSLRDVYPELDLRRGTSIRDLMLRPGATVYAAARADVANIQELFDLALVDDGSDDAVVAAVLSVYGVTRLPGARSRGAVAVVVDADRRYFIRAGSVFRGADGSVFEAVRDTVATAAGDEGVAVRPDGDTGNYVFNVDVVAETPGAAGNVDAGSAFEPEASVFGLISATAAYDFSGGSDPETPTQAVARIPATLSLRSFDSRIGIAARLSQVFGSAVRALGVQGFGDPAQVRGRDNVFAVSRPGVVDIYPKTFAAPRVVVVTKTGTMTAPNTYALRVPASEIGGWQQVKAIHDSGGAGVDGYEFAVTPRDERSDTDHVFGPSVSELAGTVYRGADVIVTGVPESDTEHDFDIELYVPALIPEIQSFADLPSIRSLGSDVVVRAPFLVLVGVRIPAFDGDFDVDEVKARVSDRINSKAFSGTLSRADVVDILLEYGSVDLGPSGFAISATVIGASGKVYAMSGDKLDIADLEAESDMLQRETCVFACEPAMVVIT